MDYLDSWNAMLTRYRREFPKLKIVPYGSSWFFRMLNKMGWHMSATTIWNTVWMDPDLMYTQRGVDMMEHEIVHVRDMHKYHILFLLTYWFLPIGPSLKAFWEWRGYQQDLAIIWHQYKGQGDYGKYVIKFYEGHVANQFLYQNYAWMLPWPWLVHKMIDRFMKTLP